MQQQQQTAVVVPQDTLDAQRMNKKHWSIEGKHNSAKIEAASLGEDLIAKKAELKHGEFKPWIEANCEFSYAAANQYMKVAKAKIDRAQLFDACTSIREVLELGKKPKPKLKPDEADLQTMARLQTLSERGATEGERQAAKEKLENFASSFGYDEGEAEEKAKEQQDQEAMEEKVHQSIEGMKRKFRSKGEEWLVEQLIWVVSQDIDLALTLFKRANQ